MFLLDLSRTVDSCSAIPSIPLFDTPTPSPLLFSTKTYQRRYFGNRNFTPEYSSKFFNNRKNNKRNRYGYRENDGRRKNSFYYTLFAFFLGFTLVVCVIPDSKLPQKLLNLKRTLRTVYAVILISMDYKLGYGLHVHYKKKGVPKPALVEKYVQGIHDRNSERLLKLLLKNGGLFIKFGQFVASLNHVLPSEYLERMSYCQDQVPFSLKFSEVRSIFREQFHFELEDVFDEFDETPIAAASIGQVYKARRKDTKEWVALKLQYPNIHNAVKSDMFILNLCCGICEFLFPEMRIKWLHHQVTKYVPDELNFITEGQHAELCGTLLQKHKMNDHISVPRVHWDLTSPIILCTEFIDGCKVNDVKAIKKDLKTSRTRVLRLLEKFYGMMLFQEGVIHADPHPGNMILRKKKEGKGIELVILDHNPYVILGEKEKIQFCKFYKASIMLNKKKLKRIARNFNVEEKKFKVLGSMILGRRWEEVEKDSVLISNEVNRKKSEEYFQNHFFEGTQVLNEINKNVLLILKTLDLTRSIHYDLRVTDTGFAYYLLVSQYSIGEHKMQKARKNLSLPRVALKRLYYSYLYYNILVFVYLYKVYAFISDRKGALKRIVFNK